MPRRGPFNPYLAGPPIKGSYGFYGRQNLVEAVVNTLTTTQHHTIVLHGQRRIGKSSLLYRLRRDENLQQAYWPVFFDLLLHTGSSPGRILANLAQTIVDELNLALALPDEAGLAADYDQFQRAFLTELYPHLGAKRLLLLCDEFDVIVPPEAVDTSAAGTLLTYLQTLSEAEQNRIAFIFVVGQRLDLLGQGYQRLFSQVRAEPVGRLSQTDTFALLTELGHQGSISYTDEALAEIWALTNGHPYMTQLLGSEIFDHLQKQPSQAARAADVFACLDKAMEHGQGALDWFWSGFERTQQLILAAIAELTDLDRSSDDAEIDEILQQYQFFLTQATRRDTYAQLMQGDFVLDRGGKRYQFAVEFIRRWIGKYHPLKEVQRQIDQSSPEAQRYYRLGREAQDRGRLTQAIEHYRLALQYNPGFSGPQLALARVLRAQDNIAEAIAECEKAYQLDPAEAREELIELHLNVVRMGEQTGEHEAVLLHLRRILEVDPQRVEARQLLSALYLAQAEMYLERDNPTAAMESIQNLVKPWSLIQEAEVGQHVRALWLNYSQQLAQQKPPRWNEAQQALNSLEALELLDETARLVYNQMTLDKVRAALERDRLEAALTILQNELKQPLPADELRELLLHYSKRQVDQQAWSQAAKAHESLRGLLDDEDSQAALLQLYHTWGDTLLNTHQYDEAIQVYRREESRPDFKQKIANAYLRKAAQHLVQHELVEAKASYRQAIDTFDTELIRDQARLDLRTYLANRRAEQAWQQATGALEILQELGLASNDEADQHLKIDLQLAQAKAYLEEERLEAAFERLATLDHEARPEIKTLIRVHLQHKARHDEWAGGEAVLERLQRLLADDTETTIWRVNWLFRGAQALFLKGKGDTDQAKGLCQKILKILETVTIKVPVIDLLVETVPPLDQQDLGLRRRVCALLADILLIEAQAYLDQDHLEAAQHIFAEALALPLPPEQLVADIETRIQTFSDRQIDQENWEQAERILQMAHRLGIGGRQINQLLTKMTMSQVYLLFKDDQPEAAFILLQRLPADLLEEEKRQEVRQLVYDFSRLYLGRQHWAAARQTLKDLHHWLPAPDQAEVVGWLDQLNREWLDVVSGKRLITQPIQVSAAELDRLAEAVQVAQEGYADARVMKLASQSAWVEAFIQASLGLGRAYLINNQLEAAVQTYQILLNLAQQRVELKAEISGQLYSFSERQLEQAQWAEARLALEALKSFDQLTPASQVSTDLRQAGALQRLLLAYTRTLLADQLEAAFSQLRQLPPPWSRAEVKTMIFTYAQERRNQQQWSQALLALQELDRLLAEDRQQIRDAEVLQWQIDTLEQWGQSLEKQKDLAGAIAIYHQALGLMPPKDDPRRFDLADHTIRLALQMAKKELNSDPLTSVLPPAIGQALQHYQTVLTLPEHNAGHERQINEALHGHMMKLAGAGQWPRAHHLLDDLDQIYGEGAPPYRTDFATWRRDLVLDEVRKLLENGAGDLDAAFERLGWLKTWLEQYQAPAATWRDTVGNVKRVVNHFSQLWLVDTEYAMAVELLTRLDQLLAKDREIKGWLVEALCQWGHVLRKQALLPEARARYEQALKEAPRQETVAFAQIERYLLETWLIEAQHHLQANDLPAAVTIYKQVLQHRSKHKGFSDPIRLALKNHSDALLQQTPPDWATAHQALDSLLQLNLDNGQVIEWRQNLTLREVAARLAQHDLAAAFASLTALERPWPVGDIQATVWGYSQAQAQTGAWQLAIEALRRLGLAFGEDSAARRGVVKKLEALGDLLETGNNLPGSEAALKAAIDLQNS